MFMPEKFFRLFLICILISVLVRTASADDGYRLWLKYDKVTDPEILNAYKKSIKAYNVIGNSETSRVIKNE